MAHMRLGPRNIGSENIWTKWLMMIRNPQKKYLSEIQLLHTWTLRSPCELGIFFSSTLAFTLLFRLKKLKNDIIEDRLMNCWYKSTVLMVTTCCLFRKTRELRHWLLQRVQQLWRHCTWFAAAEYWNDVVRWVPSQIIFFWFSHWVSLISIHFNFNLEIIPSLPRQQEHQATTTRIGEVLLRGPKNMVDGSHAF